MITVANSFVATSEAIKHGRRAGRVRRHRSAGRYNIDVDADRGEDHLARRRRSFRCISTVSRRTWIRFCALRAKHGLRVVGDAAQAHGATYKGRPIAKLADITCFSFYPGKNLGAYGDAGALVTDNEEWAVAARMFANHGRTKKYDHDFEGVNSRLDGLQAAILGVKLRYLEAWTESRRANARRYNAELAQTSVTIPQELDGVRAVYHLYVVRVPAARRAALQEFLKTAGIDTGIHYPIALPYLNAYRHLGHTEDDFPEALKASREIVSLPMFPEMTAEQTTYVARRIAEFDAQP